MLIRRIAVVALAFAALFAANDLSAQVTGDVNFYPNTRVMNDSQTGDYCGGWGGGCYEAYRSDGSVLIWDHNVGADVGPFLIENMTEGMCDLLPFPLDWICGMLF